MTLPLRDPDFVLLAARVARAFTRTRRLAFAQIAPDLTLVRGSPNLRNLMSAPPEQIEGQLLTRLFDEFVGAEEVLRAILRGDETEHHLALVNRELPDGTTQYLSFQLTALDRHQPGNGLLLLVEDTTHASLMEQKVMHDRNALRLVQADLAQANTNLVRLNRFKSFLMSMVAHDLRSPLTSINLNADLLTRDPAFPNTPGQVRAINTIRAELSRISVLIDNLLDLDQIEQGKLSLLLMPCDVNGLVRQVAQTLEPMVALRQLTLSLELPPAPLVIPADTNRLREILHNLMGNAVKYTPKQGQIHISARTDNHEAVVQVIDTGPGLTETEQANLFQPFYRADEARQRKVPGTGLGLFIVKALVEAHHGRIEVASQPGQGTTFTLRLPQHTDL